MTKTEQAQRKIVDYIILVKETDPAAICYNTNTAMVQIYGTLKLLEACGAISVTMSDKRRVITLIDAEKAPAIFEVQLETVKEEVPPVTKKVKQEKPLIVQPEKASRDTRKFTFDKVKGLSKGRLVLAVISKYAKENPVTLDQLHAAFPETEIKPYGYGLFKEANFAKKINVEGKRQRFFTKEEELVQIEKVQVAVTNQITADLLTRFLDVAKKHGYLVSVTA
jgi:hypothetical protein